MQNFDVAFAVYALVVWTCIFVILEKKVYGMTISEIVWARTIAGFFNFTVGGFIPLFCKYMESDLHWNHIFTTVFVTICFKLIVNISAYGAKSIITAQDINYQVLGKKVVIGVLLAVFLGVPIKGFYTLIVY